MVVSAIKRINMLVRYIFAFKALGESNLTQYKSAIYLLVQTSFIDQLEVTTYIFLFIISINISIYMVLTVGERQQSQYIYLIEMSMEKVYLQNPSIRLEQFVRNIYLDESPDNLLRIAKDLKSSYRSIILCNLLERYFLLYLFQQFILIVLIFKLKYSLESNWMCIFIPLTYSYWNIMV